MDLFSQWGYLAQSIGWRAPGILMSLTGLALSIIWRRRYPKTWMKVFSAMMLQLFASFVGVVYFWALSAFNYDSVWYRGWGLQVFNVALSLLDAIAIGLLVWAAFGERPKYA